MHPTVSCLTQRYCPTSKKVLLCIQKIVLGIFVSFLRLQKVVSCCFLSSRGLIESWEVQTKLGFGNEESIAVEEGFKKLELLQL